MSYEEKKINDDYDQSVAPATQPAPPYEVETVGENGGLKRQLKSRHIAMISIGGVM
jgi:amino acid permease